jgi:PTH1 family peptidyl-tRNA hydrolase
MLLFVGLGNPGSRYQGNRHNIGFMAVDAIARAHKAAPWRRKFQGEVTEATIGGEKVVLLKPETFMNESGRSVQEAQKFYKIALSDIYAFHDELDLPPGKLRIKTGGGNAGHNGLRSMTACCGNEFRRIRLGIGHPGNKDAVHHFVLSDFSKADREWVQDLCGGGLFAALGIG